LTLVVLLRRIRVVYVRWWATGAMIIVSITCEGLRLTTLGTPPDVTTLLLALVAAYLVTRLWSAVDLSIWVSTKPRLGDA
jgi:hypothetical protein